MEATAVVNDKSRVLARDRLKDALHSMREHAISTTPENISVWYHYAQGDMPQLKADIDKLIKRGEPFKEATCRDLYKRYFTEMDRRKMDLLFTALRDLIFSLVEELGAFGGGVGHYGESLTDCANKLEQDIEEDELSELVARLRVETSEAKKVTEKAREKTDALSREIAELKTNLEELERSALEDSLTNVANRRAFDQVFGDFLSKSQEESLSCCLLLIDIDHFKSFNDKYGHQAGDKVLRFVAMMLRKLVKGQDFVARYGGEEFAIVLPSTSYEGGVSLSRSICNRISLSKLTVGESHLVVDPVTVSIGVSCSEKDDTPEKLFRRADACLYKAKEAGRNQVIGQHDLTVI